MKIDGLGSPQPVDQKSKSGKQGKANKKLILTNRTDHIELTRKAESAGYFEINKSTAAANDFKTSSTDKYDRINGNIQDGCYNDKEILRRVSDKMIVSSDFEEVIAEYKLTLRTSTESESSPVRYYKIAEIQRKIEGGFYNDPAKYGKFADKIIDYFGI